MAITYVVGNPGSGKTYYAVNEIYNKHNNFEFVYTNINQFKFDEFDNVKIFDYFEIKQHLSALFDKYILKATDEELLLYCKENNIYKTLFVIDEVHNIFREKNDEILVWWLTYHRHLFHDFILITQDLTLVNNEYKRIGEYFFRAVDGGKRLFQNRLKYIQYSNYKMFMNSIVKGGSITLKKDDKIYALYHSGDFKKTKSIVVKYIYLLMFLIFIVLILIYYFFENINSKARFDIKNNSFPVEKKEEFKDSKNYSKSVNLNSENQDETFPYYVKCIDLRCYVNNNLNPIPYDYLLHLYMSEKVIYTYVYPNNFANVTERFIIFSKDVFKNLENKEYPNVQDYDSSVLSSGLSFSK